ncbi:MAG: hypothetical protein JW821_11500 [Deltaproteobacteria bacterium]|nr:hypothetical protein [Deltaproteobacteria bacterium]
MDETMEKIGPMKRVVLALEIPGSTGDGPSRSEPIEFSFIYGIGAEGLSPFECQLAERRGGDETVLQTTREEIESFFGHLTIPGLQVPGGPGRLSFRVRVLDVSPADQREIIRAMAEAASCGDHCCGHQDPDRPLRSLSKAER